MYDIIFVLFSKCTWWWNESNIFVKQYNRLCKRIKTKIINQNIIL